MQRRLKIYLENSLISMYFLDDAPYLRDLTRQFWKETLPHFEAYVSDIVLAEIRAIEDNNLSGDALHLAAASTERTESLVTWNLRHLYKRGTQEMIREVNTKLRLPVPSILTPEDFFEEEEV